MHSSVLESSTEKKDLDAVLKNAMRILGVMKESDLSRFIPYGDSPLTEDMFLRLQKTDKKALADLVRKNILDQPSKFQASQDITNPQLSSDSQEELELAIQSAMERVTAKKESDICQYIPYEGSRLHHFVYAKMKRERPQVIINLIKTNILEKKPQRIVLKYSPRKASRVKVKVGSELSRDLADLSIESVIVQAKNRKELNFQTESDFCWYIPSDKGDSFMHYSTYRSMKKNNPNQLKTLIYKHIVLPKTPKKFSSFSRKSTNDQSTHASPAPSQITEDLGLEDLIRKTYESITTLSESLKSARNSGNETQSEEGGSERVLRTIQNQLIKQIRQKQVDFELWDTYVELVS